MRRFFLGVLLLTFSVVFLKGQLSLANYDDENTGTSGPSGGSSGSGLGTQLAVGTLSYLVNRAIEKKAQKNQSASEAWTPPSVVTVVEFPLDAAAVQPGGAETEIIIQKGDKPVTVKMGVPIAAPPGEGQKCCKVTSLVISNIWQHAVKVSVNGKGSQVIAPGGQATFTGDFGECPRIKVESAEPLGETDANLVAEDVSLCCRDLKAGNFKRFYAIRILRFNFVELDKDCPEQAPPNTPEETPKASEPPPEKPQVPPAPEPQPPKVPEPPKKPEIPPIAPPSTPPPVTQPPEKPPMAPPAAPPLVPPDTPPTTTEQGCQCCCHLVTSWTMETPIQYKIVSPAEGRTLEVPLGSEVPLAVNAIDQDAVTMACQKTGCGGESSGGEGQGGGPCKACPPCQSAQQVRIASRLQYRWELFSGAGALKTDLGYPSKIAVGPAAVYMAPEVMPNDRQVLIRLVIDDNPEALNDIDDSPADQMIVFSLAEAGLPLKVPSESANLNYATTTGIPSADCSCLPKKEWGTYEGITARGKSGTDYTNVCADGFAVLSVEGSDADQLGLKCQDPACSSPGMGHKINDALIYGWEPSKGSIIGSAEKVVYQAPAKTGFAVVKTRVSDSGIQAPDSSVDGPVFRFNIGKITIKDLRLPEGRDKALELGDDLKIDYEIEPLAFAFEKAELRIYNNKGNLVYKREGLPASGGKYSTVWEKTKWNQEPHIGAYANPKNSPYQIQIAGSAPNCAAAGRDVDTQFVIHAEIRDIRAGSAERASGLAQAMKTLEVRLNGVSGRKTFKGTDLKISDIEGLPEGSYGKAVLLQNQELNQLENGRWTIQVRDVSDGVGNVFDANPSTPKSDAYESELELW